VVSTKTYRVAFHPICRTGVISVPLEASNDHSVRRFVLFNQCCVLFCVVTVLRLTAKLMSSLLKEILEMFYSALREIHFTGLSNTNIITIWPLSLSFCSADALLNRFLNDKP